LKVIAVNTQNSHILETLGGEPEFPTEFYRTVVEHASEAMSVLQHGRTVYRNKAHRQLLGCRAGDAEPWAFLASVVPEDRLRVREYYHKCLQGEDVPAQYEVGLLTHEGRRITAVLRPCVITLHGQPATLVVLQDVTVQKQAERALQEAHWRTRLVLEAIPSILIGLDTAERITWWNTTAETTFGLTQQAVIGRFWSECHMQWEGGRIAAGLAQSRATAMVVRLDDVPFRRASGEVRLLGLTINPMQGYAGEPCGFLLLGTDITARKQVDCEREEMMRFLQETNNALEELSARVQQSHAETEQLLAAISSMLIGVDAQGRIVRWNAIAEGMFGLAAAEVLGQSFAACGIQWEGAVIQACMAACQQTGQPTPVMEMRYQGQDGKERVLGVTMSPMCGSGKTAAGFLLIGVDITQRKVMEAHLAQAQKLESIGQLAAGIAHEINTPTQYIGDNTRFLQDVFGDLDGLLERYATLLQATKAGMVTETLLQEIETAETSIDVAYLRQEIPQAIQQSLEGVECVATIVRAMKDFSHPGGAEKTAIDLNKAIESTITVARNEWKYVADMVTDLDPTLPLVPCFPGPLNQVVLNIIVNAAHAIADVGRQEKGTITLTTRRDGDWAEVRVADTGCGIPASIRERIFDPFFTTKDVGKGTGQGLAIAHDVVVRQHAGTLTFETVEGCGSSFIIRLPLREALSLQKAGGTEVRTERAYEKASTPGR
jgi:PAS domain S-box-containing protein